MKSNKKVLINIIITTIFAIIISLLTIIFFKNLGGILNSFGEEILGDVFSQLQNAEISIPLLIPVVIIFLINRLILKFNFQKKKLLKIILIFVIYILSIIIMLIFSILFSKSNGITFLDVLISLLNNLGGLGL